MSDSISKLTDFPHSYPGYGRKVAVVGLGSCGCRIASELSKQSKLIEHFVYITCDEVDIAAIEEGKKILVDAIGRSKSTPASVRGLTVSHLAEIRNILGDSKLTFIISGLGGPTGSGLAPLVVREVAEMGAMPVAILVMPYNFEKSKHFHAGVALKYIRELAEGVIIIDNDELLQDDMAIIDAYGEVNRKIAEALNKLLGSPEEHEFSVGLNNVVNFVRTNSYSVLCVGDSGAEISEYNQAVIDAAKHFDGIVDKREASKSIVHLCTEKSITMNDLVASIGGLSGILGNGTMSIEYGLSANSTSTSRAFIMATGFSKTKFDSYDPVDRILSKIGKGNIDHELDFSPQMDEVLISNVEAD